jgi:hypothetical protein
MAREYKLRLGDGTVLAVDEQGLRTWAIDGKASVQAGGTGQWRPLKEVLAEVAASAPSAGRGGRRDDGIPIIPLKPIDDRRPPTPVGDLPALHLAAEADDDFEEPGDLYEGNSVIGVLWLWTKRLVLMGALVAGIAVAATTWPTWLPYATRFGLEIFGRIDAYAHPERARKPVAGGESQRQMQEAVQKASAQLPHLSAETIQLVMSGNVWSVPDPAEVFSRAYAAAKRGAPSLPRPEAEELKTIETALLAGLRSSERERAREYDRVRLQRATLPTEDREMAGLVARGARALPAPSRERLQALLGKAVAAGLAAGGG